MLALFFGHVCAIAVGISLGLMGGGGSILAVPILVYVMGVGAKNAIAISLGSVGVVSLIGTILHWRKGNVRVDIVLAFAPAAMVGAYLGARLAGLPGISEAVQLFCFSIMMLLASSLMIFKSRRKHQAIKHQATERKSTEQQTTDSQTQCIRDGKDGEDGEQKSYLSERSGDRKPSSQAWSKLMIPAEGLGIGLLTGFVGIGGGFAIVPALVLLTKIPMKQAVGTSLLIITLNTVTGFLGYLGQTDINWLLASSFTLAACIGILVGSYLNKFIKASTLQASFGYFVLSFAVLMLMAQFSF